MAHPCDHYEKQTYITNNRSKLKMSPSTMNKSNSPIKLSSPVSKVSISESHAYILASNFIRDNDNWAIKSAMDYCLKYYSEFGLTKEIFALAVTNYIMSK